MKGLSTFCRISESSYTVNGNEVNYSDTPSLGTLYKSLGIKYPKFHKMDKLAKTAFLGVELLLNHNPDLKNLEDDEIAILFANSESSEYSDLKFHESYTVGDNPSPSQFVYTLPNILMGEIAIRNKWYGESLFFVSPSFNEKEYSENIITLFQSNTKACVCGWVNVLEDQFDAFFFVIEKGKEIDQKLFEVYQSKK